MHIPFLKDKEAHEERHVISLADHTHDNDTLEEEVDDPSPSAEGEGLPPILERPAITSQAVEVATGLIDVLYENQRGSFLCGIPLFSAAGLWVTDPHAWTAIDHKYTPFTIFNATLPDPTWEWVWKRWFVDMSGDVDENGWTYNLNFTRHHWHGHHIWYHSFVRRRRWLRKRRKIKSVDRVKRKQKNPADDFTTIYSSVSRGRDQRSVLDDHTSYADEGHDDGESNLELENLGEFYQRLRGARLDREKLDAVQNFLRYGKDLAALAGEMQHILGFMIFEESRRQLLTMLAQQCQALEVDHENQSTDQYGNIRHRCVKNAIEMADLLVNKLRYYSDRQRVLRAEEDAEMQRIIASRLKSQERGEPNEAELQIESLDDFEVPSLQQTLHDASQEKTTKPSNRRKVSFMDDEAQSDQLTEQESNQTSYTRSEKGKEREH